MSIVIWVDLPKSLTDGAVKGYNYDINGDCNRFRIINDNMAGDVTNGTVTKYIRGIQLISSKTGSNESFYTYNAQGDVVQLTNGSGDPILW